MRGLRVTIVNREDDSSVLQVIFHEFPVRIGRDALAEISLRFGFITRWHAMMTVEGDAVLVWDLGSTNGTMLGSPPARLAPHEKVDLRQHGMTFQIGPLQISVEVVDAAPAPRVRDRGGPMLSSVMGNAPAGPRQDGAIDAAIGAEARALANELRAPYDEYRAGWMRFYERLASRLEPLRPAARAQVLRLIASELPAALAEPDFQRLASSLGIAPGDVRAEGAMNDADVALQVLKELAEWYHTPQTLAGSQAIVGFGQKVQDALDALFAGYLPLRNGLKTFGAEFDVNQGPEHQRGASGVAQAQTQLEVGARVLDWNDPMDSAHAFRSLFADLMVHNVSLINGVMKGAGALLQRLSPDALTHTFEEAKRAGRTGISLGIYRYRELWRTLELRHRDLASEEQETFATLFGQEFAATYQQLFSAAASDPSAAPRPPRPVSRASISPGSPAAGSLGGSGGVRPGSAPPAERAPAKQATPPAKPQGPTGTVVAARAPAARPSAEPSAPADGAPPSDYRSR